MDQHHHKLTYYEWDGWRQNGPRSVRASRDEYNPRKMGIQATNIGIYYDLTMEHVDLTDFTHKNWDLITILWWFLMGIFGGQKNMEIHHGCEVMSRSRSTSWRYG
jgi:hypothetical protein